jgi:hypothetical protein
LYILVWTDIYNDISIFPKADCVSEPKTDSKEVKEGMSGPTLHIGGTGSFPEISAVYDEGRSLDVSQNDFDLNLLGNQRKIAGSMGGRSASPASFGGQGAPDLKAVDDIEFVSLEDTNVSFDVKTPSTSNDQIRIVRDAAQAPSVSFSAPTSRTDAPFQLGAGSSSTTTSSSYAPTSAPAPAPAPAKSWFSSLTGSGGAPAPAPQAPAPAAGTGGFRSWFGGTNSGTQAPVAAATPTVYLTPEQESTKKSEGLTILERMDRKGISGTKMSMSNSLEEIDAEVARRKDSKGLEASVRFQRSMLTTVTSGMEFLNSRYDPLGLALDGWSEQVNENIEDYDEIFEELYDKYKDKSKVAPEVRLILSLGLSAGMCHVTNTMFKSRMPGMDDILRKNPELARQFAKAAATESVGPGFANFVSMGMGGGAGGGNGGPRGGNGSMAPPPSFGGQGNPGPSMPPSQSYADDAEPAGMSPPLGGGAPFMSPAEGMSPPPTIKIRRELRGPSGVDVDDILQQLEANRGMPSGQRTPRNDLEEVGSIASGYTTETMKRNGVSRRALRKTTMQPTGAELTLNV